VRTLSRRELTAALAARQLLVERARLSPAAAMARLTPLQAQEPRAPFVGLAARVEGFRREHLEAALTAGEVVKTTINRRTLHLSAAADYPAFARVAREAALRSWRSRHPDVDEEEVARDLRAFLAEPRTNEQIRERVRRWIGDDGSPWGAVLFARAVLPLVQLPPAGFWGDPMRGARFVVHPAPLPDPVDAAERVVRRYLAAFGPASRRDLASWSGAPQRDFAAALERVGTVVHRDERGTELLDLPGAPLPDASTRLPVRLLGRWDQALLAYADRDRIIPSALQPLKLTLSGDATVTVAGRVAASWTMRLERGTAKITVTPHVDVSQRARASIRAEARRTARTCHPDARRVEVAGV